MKMETPIKSDYHANWNSIQTHIPHIIILFFHYHALFTQESENGMGFRWMEKL